jgi:hypothetical protein
MRYLRRFLWFITVRLFGLCVIGAALVIAFYMAMNITNIIILTSDGMASRARVIVGTEEDPAILAKFFTTDCLTRESEVGRALAGESPYADYDIRGMDHRVSIDWMWTWPWDYTASAVARETVTSIDGKVKPAKRDALVAANGDGAVNPPAWASRRYSVSLLRDNGRWIISSITLTD